MRLRVVDGLDVIALAFVLATLASSLWVIASAQPKVWVDILTDDTYYYLGIARSILERGVSSFAPPFETNGYQPLWLMLLTVTGAVFGTSPTSQALQAMALSGVFILGFGYAARRFYGAGFAALLVIFQFPMVMLVGMETVMIPLFFVLYMQAKDWRHRGAFGVLLALSRLDALTLVVARDLYMFATTRKFDHRPYLIIAPAALVYAVINFWLFGTPVPVSGLAKAIGNVRGENLSTMLSQYAEYLNPSLMFVALLAAVMVITRTPISALRHADKLATSAIAFAACVLYYGFASGWPIWDWYAWPALLVKFYLLQETWEIAQRNVKHLNWKRMLAATALTAVAVVASARWVQWRMQVDLAFQAAAAQPDRIGGSFGRVNVDIVPWMKANLPPGSLVAMGDRAGSLGFFHKDLHMLQTEGLVAPFAFIRAMQKDEALAFARAQGVDYWMVDRPSYLETADTIGMIEPIQGISARSGVFLVCFARASIVLDRTYSYGPGGNKQRRLLFDAKGEHPCPDEFVSAFERMKSVPHGVRNFSLSQPRQTFSEPVREP